MAVQLSSFRLEGFTSSPCSVPVLAGPELHLTGGLAAALWECRPRMGLYLPSISRVELPLPGFLRTISQNPFQAVRKMMWCLLHISPLPFGSWVPLRWRALFSYCHSSQCGISLLQRLQDPGRLEHWHIVFFGPRRCYGLSRAVNFFFSTDRAQKSIDLYIHWWAFIENLLA